VGLKLDLGLGVNSGGKFYTYQPETKTLLAALSGTYSTPRKIEIDKMIKSLKAAGVWAKLDVLQMYAAPTAADAVINWKNPGTFNATLVNSPTLEVDRGITGDASSKYIRSGFIPSNGVNFTQNSAGIHIGIKTESQNSTDIGAFDGANWVRFVVRYIDIYSGFRLNQTVNTFVDTASTSVGLFSVNRTASNSMERRRNKVSTATSTDTSTGVPTVEIYIGAENNNGTAQQYSARQYAFFAASSGLNATESDAFADAVENYLDYIGAGVIA